MIWFLPYFIHQENFMKNKIKLIAIIAIIAIIGISMAACSGKEGSGGAAAAEVAEAAASSNLNGNWYPPDANSMFVLNVYDGTFTLLYGSLSSNRGTYTESGSSINWTVEAQGLHGVAEGTTGTATLENGVITGWIMDEPLRKRD